MYCLCKKSETKPDLPCDEEAFLCLLLKDFAAVGHGYTRSEMVNLVTQLCAV